MRFAKDLVELDLSYKYLLLQPAIVSSALNLGPSLRFSKGLLGCNLPPYLGDMRIWGKNP